MYANGMIPLSKLVHLGANFYLPPGTAARWRWLVDAARDKYGVTLRITPDRSGLGGWNAYRPLFAQKAYKKALGPLASAVGKSSHGGVYKGREAFSVDVDNWEDLGWSRFKSLCRLAGFTVDFVSPQERWHIGDLTGTGWVVPAHLRPPTINRETTRIYSKEEEPMTGRFTYVRSSDRKTVRVVHGEAMFEEHTDPNIKNSDINMSLNLPKDAPWPSMPESYRDSVWRACHAVRAGTAGVHRNPDA